MFISDEIIVKEVQSRIDSLEKNINILGKAVSEQPKGVFVKKWRGNREYIYLSYYDNGKHKTEYVSAEKLPKMEKSIRDRDYAKQRILRLKREQADWQNLLHKKNCHIFTDIVCGYISDEQERNIKMLQTYRMLEIEALKESRHEERKKYKSICSKIEKKYLELARCVLEGKKYDK